MTCERTRRNWGWLAGLLAAIVLLSFPAAGLAADQLTTAGTLTRGAGYSSPAESQPVRELQRNLQRLGARPGPVDGLFGPLTEAAVQRFQGAHGLATDGVVGPQTKSRLLALGAKRSATATSRQTHTGQLTRKSPSGGTPDESAIEQHPARIAPSVALTRAGPPASEGTPPELLALLAVLAAGALLLALRTYGRRAREATVNFGMVCAALLATFVIGAATGAVFATQAAPDAGGEAFADSGALLAARGAPSHVAARKAREVRREAQTQTRGARPAPKARRSASRARVAARPAPPLRSPAPADSGRVARLRPAPRGPQAVVQRPRPAPVRSSASTYTVQPGDALWPIAERHLASSRSVTEIAQQVQELESLNRDRIASGDPDLLEAGEELRLR
jgi:peptidoglycan hydrolase-like protein with peptidoglycan-binding domain